jgi:hypothetical protein
MKDYSYIDERSWALLNAQADAELSESEQHELDALLTESEELRDIQAELGSFIGCLNEVPEETPPAWLHNAITSTVRLPVESSGKAGRLSFSGWLAPVFALAAGVMLTVGVYETNLETMSSTDATNMSGTIINSRPSTNSQLIDSLTINGAEASGSAELRMSGQSFFIDVALNTTQPSAFMLDYSASDLAFIGFDISQNQVDGVLVGAGRLSVESTGEQHFTLKFQSPKSIASTNAQAFKIDILVNKSLVQQAELRTDK